MDPYNYKNRDISAKGTKGRRGSPNSSESVTRRFPESKSSFQICSKVADNFRVRPLLLLILGLALPPLSSASDSASTPPLLLGIRLEDGDSPALESTEGVEMVASCMLKDGSQGTAAVIGPSIAVLFKGRECSEFSAISLRLSSKLPN